MRTSWLTLQTLKQMSVKATLLAGLLVCMGRVMAADSPTLPQYAPDKHLGVATCGNSTCHGVKLLDETSNVRQNEYHTWLFNDRHSKAYNTLLSEQSKSIARKMGLKDAATAGVCLDCHADNVPVDKRGPEFHITDGVGCEACHGGSERWIGSHTITPYNGQRNLDQGMYPTGPLHSRTELCASCHVGDSNKLANHNIMGAGHPRLSFELDTFVSRQPVHYDVDQDYLKRKGPANGTAINNVFDTPIKRLMVGAAVHAQVTAKNLSSELMDHPQGFPEIALFNCYSCHKPIDSPNWQSRPSTAGLRPGTVRLNDGSFILLAAVTGAVDERLQKQLMDAIKQLHNASRKSVTSVKQAAQQLNTLSQQAETTFKRATLNQSTAQALLKQLARYGANGEYRDYTAAEQAVMAMDAINYQYPGNAALEQTISQAFTLTQDDERYQPNKLKQLLKQFYGSL